MVELGISFFFFGIVFGPTASQDSLYKYQMIVYMHVCMRVFLCVCVIPTDTWLVFGMALNCNDKSQSSVVGCCCMS